MDNMKGKTFEFDISTNKTRIMKKGRERGAGKPPTTKADNYAQSTKRARVRRLDFVVDRDRRRKGDGSNYE